MQQVNDTESLKLSRGKLTSYHKASKHLQTARPETADRNPGSSDARQEPLETDTVPQTPPTPLAKGLSDSAPAQSRPADTAHRGRRWAPDPGRE